MCYILYVPLTWSVSYWAPDSGMSHCAVRGGVSVLLVHLTGQIYLYLDFIPFLTSKKWQLFCQTTHSNQFLSMFAKRNGLIVTHISLSVQFKFTIQSCLFSLPSKLLFTVCWSVRLPGGKLSRLQVDDFKTNILLRKPNSCRSGWIYKAI